MRQKDYQALHEHGKRSRLLESISYLLEWDQETYMPKEGYKNRAEQLSLVASLHHKEKTSRGFESALRKLIDLKTGKIVAKGLSFPEQTALKRWRTDFLKAKALPNAFVREFAKLSAESIAVWGETKKKGDFKTFAPYLEKIVAMCRKKADLLTYEEHPYDALLDLFEPGVTTYELTALFGKLKKPISDLVGKIKKKKQVDDSCLHGKFSETKQLAFARVLLEAMGYDLNKGRLDLSNHPFSITLHPTDSRITTRIHKSSIFDNLSSTMHEAGHSLYEMNMPEKHYGSPLAEAASYGIHESQSRFWETRIGQSEPFWHHFYPLLKKAFAPHFDKISLQHYYKAINKVEPSLIRVESDEVTYTLHVILRFELEKSLIDGKLAVKDLPEAWNAKMQELLGLTPESPREGCMQDVHWSMGAFGYFPSYALGNLYASAFFEAFEKAHPDWEKRVASGELPFIVEWLKNNIHIYGRTYLPTELVKRVSGQSLTPRPYLEYLNKKYGAIYSL